MSVKGFIKHCRLSFENFVLWFFRTLNLNAHLKITLRKIRHETTEHIDYLSSTLKQVVLPLSICYLCLGFFFGNNVVDSLFLGLVIFVYSHFLPDLLSPFRIKNRKERDKDRPWFKKHALLFLAPIVHLLAMGRRDTRFENHRAFPQRKIIRSLQHFLVGTGLDFLWKRATFIGKNS